MRTPRTDEEREAARRAKRAKNRSEEFAERMRQTRGPRARLSVACHYLRAVADDLSAEEIEALVPVVVRLAQEREPSD